jgi:DNA-binding winged helix-turn-helix (wHTH) protein
MPKKLSPVQRKMLEVLADGERHKRSDLHACLWDDKGPLSNVHAHISAIRKHLQHRGESIVCELYNGTLHYRHVRLLRS